MMVEMSPVNNTSNTQVELTVNHAAVEAQMACRIQSLVQSNSELVLARKRPRGSYKTAQAEQYTTDVERVLWQIEQPLEDAEV